MSELITQFADSTKHASRVADPNLATRRQATEYRQRSDVNATISDIEATPSAVWQSPTGGLFANGLLRNLTR
jgi:hypothetical protein